MSRIKVKHAGR